MKRILAVFFFLFGGVKLEHVRPVINNPLVTSSGEKLHGGDMILSEEQIEGLYGTKGTRKAIGDLRLRWTNGNVYYRLLAASEPDRNVIEAGIRHWMENSCLKFYEVSASVNQPHLYFNKSSGCTSYVGMQNRPKGQQVSIGEGCDSLHIVAHEVGHAIGFYHEQNRPDRDQYIKIIESNIKKDYVFAFNLENSINNYGVPYDFTSVMHYGLTSFTSNGKKTMVTLDPFKEFDVDRGTGLSFYDMKLANIMYNCSDQCQAKPNCQNGGFVTERCQCKCPPGFGGSQCQNRESLPAKCAQTISSPTRLTSPNYPKKYPKSRCIYVVQAPEGKQIQLSFGDFDLLYRSDETCPWDYLEIREGNAYDGNIYCGTELKNQNINIQSNRALLFFKANYDWNKGYSVDIKFI